MKFSHTALFCALLLSPLTAQAQLNQKPFSFNTPNGSVGMSIGGKQAILNDGTFKIKPKNMLRVNNGSLLTVTRSKGNSALITTQGGDVIPAFKGSSHKGANTTWNAGSFNSFFSPKSFDGSASNYNNNIYTSAVVSTWTERVATQSAVSYVPNSSVETWTGMVVDAGY